MHNIKGVNMTSIYHTNTTYQCNYCGKEHETDDLLITFHASDDASIHSPNGYVYISNGRDQHFCTMTCFIGYLTRELGCECTPVDTTLKSILTDCAKMRGCWPCVNRSESEFVEWLIDNQCEKLIYLALQFKKHCVEKYSGS